MKETFPDVECEGPPKGCGGGSQCSANADCIDSPSSENEQQYTCRCKQGYQGNGQICSRSKEIFFQSLISLRMKTAQFQLVQKNTTN